jgi:hypothetical protein
MTVASYKDDKRMCVHLKSASAVLKHTGTKGQVIELQVVELTPSALSSSSASPNPRTSAAYILSVGSIRLCSIAVNVFSATSFRPAAMQVSSTYS